MTLKQENSIILGIFIALFVILVSISIFTIPLRSKARFFSSPADRRSAGTAGHS